MSMCAKTHVKDLCVHASIFLHETILMKVLHQFVHLCLAQADALGITIKVFIMSVRSFPSLSCVPCRNVNDNIEEFDLDSKDQVCQSCFDCHMADKIMLHNGWGNCVFLPDTREMRLAWSRSIHGYDPTLEFDTQLQLRCPECFLFPEDCLHTPGDDRFFLFHSSRFRKAPAVHFLQSRWSWQLYLRKIIQRALSRHNDLAVVDYALNGP